MGVYYWYVTVTVTMFADESDYIMSYSEPPVRDWKSLWAVASMVLALTVLVLAIMWILQGKLKNPEDDIAVRTIRSSNSDLGYDTSTNYESYKIQKSRNSSPIKK